MPWFIALMIFVAFNFILVSGSTYYFSIDAWFAYVYHWDWHHGYPDWHPDPFKPLPPPPGPHTGYHGSP